MNHPNGKRKEIAIYKIGERHGERKLFNDTNQLIKTEYYFNGSVYKTE
jgi:antitoxin component YwqK of YwqJK toxin-antitoxin module